jgi:hypothetical protein
VLAATAGAVVGPAGTAVGTVAADSDDVQIGPDEGSPSLRAGPGQVIDGEAVFPAGHRLSVLVYGPDGGVVAAAPTVVDHDDEFRAVVDLTGATPRSALEVVVYHDGESIGSAEATVRACRAACEPSSDPPDADVVNDPDTVGPGRSVVGRSSLPAGTDLTVRVANATGDRPQFSVRDRATVGADGRFRAVVDLGVVPADSPVRIDVFHDGRRLESVAGSIGPCKTDCGDDERRGTRVRGDLPFATALPGEVAVIPVTIGGGEDVAAVTIGGPVQTYTLAATVEDGTGDGRVTLLVDVDTARDGPGGIGVGTLTDGDAVRIYNETWTAGQAGGGLDPGEYRIEQYDGQARATGGPDDEGMLRVGRDSGTAGEAASVARFGLPDTTDVRADGNATIPLRTDETTVATLVVRDEDYRLVARVADGTGDERVPVRVDPAAAGNASGPTIRAVDAGDEVTVLRERGQFRPSEYAVVLAPGHPSNVLADEGDRETGRVYTFRRLGRLVVSEPLASPTVGAEAADGPGPVIPVGGLGALVTGAVLAVVAIGLVLGLFERSV